MLGRIVVGRRLGRGLAARWCRGVETGHATTAVVRKRSGRAPTSDEAGPQTQHDAATGKSDPRPETESAPPRSELLRGTISFY